jgi:hypothetical protein
MNSDPNVHWELANDLGIQIDGGGQVWHTGCVRDVLVLPSDEVLVASDTGGVWSVNAAAATSLADMDPPDLWCLAQGPDGDKHVYAGGAGLYETDLSVALPLGSWNGIPLIDDKGNELGTVFRVLALAKPRKLVLATASGVYYSDIPPPAGRQYTFHKVKNIADQGYLGLAAGPGGGVAVASWGDDQSRADIFYGGWQGDELILRTSVFRGGDWARLLMFATTLASCRDHPEHMYAISSDADGFVAVFLRSGDGGATWDAFQPKLDGSVAEFRQKAGNQGNDSRPCNDIAVAPNAPNTVAVVWRTGGVFISSDSGDSWKLAMGDPHVHSDLHRVRFDPRDDAALTIYLGGDGGVVWTGDRGRTWDSTLNQHLPILQVQSWPNRSFYGGGSPSPRVDGLLTAALQDNGNVSCMLQPSVTAWKTFGHMDDGELNCFVATGHLLYYFNDDAAVQDLGWDPQGQPQNHTYTPLRGPGGEVAISNLIVAPVRAPKHRNGDGELMFAVGVEGKENQDGSFVHTSRVYGFFSRDDGSDKHWEELAYFGEDQSPFSAVGAFDGSTVFLGTTDGQLLSFQPGALGAFEYGLDMTAPAGGEFYQIVASSNDDVFASYNIGSNGYVFARDQAHFSQMRDLPDTDQVFGLETVDEGDRGFALFVATDDRVYVTRDRGVNWLDASIGLPRRPHGCDLHYVVQSDANGYLYLSTYGRSAWRAQLQFDIKVPTR